MSSRSRWARYARDLDTLPEDAGLAYRRGGFPELWQVVAERTVHRLIRWGRVLVIVQRLDELREVSPPPGIVIRKVENGDLPALVELMSRREVERIAENVGRGRICLVAWRGTRPVGYGWTADRFGSDMTAIACPLALPHTATYLWNLYVAPDERGRGVGAALGAARLRLARDRGLKEAWRMIAPDNHASLRTVARTGGPSTRIIGELWYLKLATRVFGQFRPLGTPLAALNLGPAAPAVSPIVQ